MRTHTAARDCALLYSPSYLPTRPPLPASAVEYWHSDFGVGLVSGAVNTWTGQIRSIVCTAPTAGQRPNYAPDGLNFGGRPVVQAANTGALYLRTAAPVAAIFASGSRPYVLAVCRSRVTPVTYAGGIATLAGNPVSADLPGLYYDVNGRVVTYGPGGSATNAVAPGNRPVVIEGFYDAAGSLITTLNGAGIGTASGATGLSLSSDVVHMTIGAYYTGGTYVGDGSIAAIVLCSSVPTAAERAALREWAFTEWSFPQSYERIFGPLLVDYWDARSSVGVSSGKATSWSGQVVGTALNNAAPGVTARPVYGADSTFFGGQSVIQFDGVNDTLQIVAMGTALYNVPRPHWLIVSRLRAAPSTQENVLTAEDSPLTSEIPQLYITAAGVQVVQFYNFATILTGASPGTAVHLAEALIRSSDGNVINALDGVDTVGASAGAGVNVACKSIYLGNSRDVGNWAHASLAAVVCLNDSASAAQRAAYLAYTRSAWSF